MIIIYQPIVKPIRLFVAHAIKFTQTLRGGIACRSLMGARVKFKIKLSEKCGSITIIYIDSLKPDFNQQRISISNT